MSNIQAEQTKASDIFEEEGGVINDLILYYLLKVWIMEL